jgi:bone morphogenetic protein receptor type-1B
VFRKVVKLKIDHFLILSFKSIRRKRLPKTKILRWIENSKHTPHQNYDYTSNATTFTSTTKENNDFSSGSGPTELIQRTIARDIRIDYTKPLGQGRFGVVWKAKWNDDFVAVKSFFSMHECSWARETDIYETCMLRHDNILGFIAADIKGNGHSVSMLLVTEYHSIGSLYDFLQEHTIDYELLKKFSISIINGLNHLHTEIFSTKCKPAIAHRDLKSKNILVKSSYECCIADFGLAVRFNSENNKLDVGTNQIREGSQRYMAPECLNESLNVRSIDELKSCDIYSFSLVIWELIRCFAETDGLF